MNAECLPRGFLRSLVSWSGRSEETLTGLRNAAPVDLTVEWDFVQTGFEELTVFVERG